MTTSGAGVLYLALGEQHSREAVRSIETLRTHNPSLPVAVFTDQPDMFDIPVTKISETKSPLKHKVAAMLETPFSSTLYLDTDTFIRGDLSPVFESLDRHDFGACRPPWFSRQENEITFLGYATDKHFNTGVIAYQIDSCRKVFEQWADCMAAQDDTKVIPGVLGDQYHFNTFVIETDAFKALRVDVLDNRLWNLRCYALGPAKRDGVLKDALIVHTREWEALTYWGLSMDDFR